MKVANMILSQRFCGPALEQIGPVKDVSDLGRFG